MNPLPTKRHCYCSKDCKSSIDVFCYPQSKRSRAWHLIERQAGACALCGISHEDLIEKRIKRFRESWPGQKATLWYIGNGLHDLEVDHIVPIFKGGEGLGIWNHQVVCAKCHRMKTALERSTASGRSSKD